MHHRRSSIWDVIEATGLGLIVCGVITACASNSPKSPPPPPTPDQVRSHADRTFDKLKQDEKERATQADTPR